MPRNLIYLDYQATTPPDEKVLEAMVSVYRENYGNPHSAEHAYGWRAQEIVETARASLARLIGVRSSGDIIFTSGATESNNLAIKGIAMAHKRSGGKRRRILVNPIEHKCALESCLRLREEGFTVEVLPMGRSGIVEMESIVSAMGDDVLLLVLQAVNNEIGTIQPVVEAASLCLERGVLLHCDGAQVPGRLAFSVGEHVGISTMSLSGHKFYGPKGVGALYIRRRPEVSLLPLFDGGGQERGLRSGTLPAALLSGLGVASDLAVDMLESDIVRAASLRDLFLSGLEASGIDFSVNGAMGLGLRVASNLSLHFPSVSRESFFHGIRGIAVSSGSACSSGDVKSFSHVLRAIGVEASDSSAYIRLGLGRPTTESDIASAVDAIVSCVRGS